MDSSPVGVVADLDCLVGILSLVAITIIIEPKLSQHLCVHERKENTNCHYSALVPAH